MTASVLLARHGMHAEVGHVLSGRSEIPLSAQGRAEAMRLSRRLVGIPLAAIHSSPRRRALETAQAVARHHDLPIRAVDALDEIDFGAWSGHAFSDLDADPAWRRWNAARGSAATPAGETMAMATSRALDHLQSIEEEGPVLCVSHCDIIRGVVAHVLGLDADRLLSFDCDTGSLTTLALFDTGGRVATLNERPR